MGSSHSRPLKAKLIILLFYLSCTNMLAQELNKVKSIPFEHEVVHASIDRQGNVYIASKNGDIDRYDKEGTLAYHFSPDTKGNVSLIEGWQGLRTFVFYRDFQQYLFLDRFLNSPNRLNIGSDPSRYYQWATLAGDNNLWLVDQQELSLKKLDIEINDFLVETPFNLNLDPENFQLTHIREYQNLLFISDVNSGILVFDNLGNYLESLPISGLDYFSFRDNELFGLIEPGKVASIDIYSKKVREISLPDLSYKYVLMENSLLFAISNDRMDIFQIR